MTILNRPDARAQLVQRFEVHCVANPIKPGWVQIDARLKRRSTNVEGWLVTRYGPGDEKRVPLPVTLKGTIHELVYVGESTGDFWLETLSDDPVSPKGKVVLKQVNAVICWLLMWRRVFIVISGLPKRRRRALGFTWPVALFNPVKAYALAGRSRNFASALTYPDWIALCEQHTTADRRRLSKMVKRHKLNQRLLDIVIDARNIEAAELIFYSLNSLKTQLEIPYRLWILDSGCIHTDLIHKSNLPMQIISNQQFSTILTGDKKQWLLFMPAGTELAPWALAWFAWETQNEKTGLIFADHDYLVNDERANPIFKPDWSEELARSSAYIGDTFAVRGDILKEVHLNAGYTGPYQTMLDAAALANASGVSHIPAILSHRRTTQPPPCRDALTTHLNNMGIDAEVESVGHHLRVRYQLPAALPKVSIIVPTKDQLFFLKTCISSVLEKTSWPDYELLIIDNQSVDKETLRYLETLQNNPQINVLQYDQPFNFSAINNFAVEQANGDVICLLNNDTEVITADWLEEMVSRLMQPGIGVVGARLYFSDGRVQHAGDVLGPGGCASHLHGVIEADDPGYMHRAILPQDLSAVTAACLVTRKAIFQQLGGLDAANLPVAFNDVDYCLRVREAGWRVIYTPYAELYHHESVSRGKDNNPEKRERAKREAIYMRQRWSEVIERDPFYNPNLNYSRPDFRLGKYPRVTWPWSK